MVRIISALILAATAACAFAAEPLELVADPPDRYIVVKGDTLWGISGKFLKEPWRWPEIWRMNRDQIKNPHLIYPGDVVMLDLSGDSPRLRHAKGLGSGSNADPGKVQPKVYSTAVQEAIPSIPPNAIEPFISRPLILEPGAEIGEAVIVATAEGRVLVGNGDEAFASGIPDASIEKWHVFRPGKPLKDPDSGEVLAHEAFFLGHARLVKPGEPATLRIVQAKQEIGRGDRLLPAPPPQITSYVPHKPDGEISAKVISIYGGLSEGGTQSVIAINRGGNDGLEIGHVLALFSDRVSVAVDEDGRRTSTPIPEDRYALAFVFRVFDGIAYALVVESSRSVLVGDAVRNP
ncbi:MAG: LysM peptidoglycan-binding domain-containing protein [Betaproteobacteria bacterium]|nr:LysM peptidoglycan-binding domain-containing protein [Betaproteobacteria bacterium]MCL2885460.1 LysM peptidoglycan-binding domain-containing protein [Betaproteobacteria bacterium]